MRKRIHEAVSIVLLLSMSCMFMGCPSDSDSDSDSGSGSNSSGLTATLQKYKWMSDAEYEFTDFTKWVELTKDVFVYYFMSDTEGVLRNYHKWIDTSGIDDEGLYVSNIYFAYTVNGNTVNIRFIDSNFPRVTFTYDGNNLTSQDGDVLKAVTPSTGDWAQVKALFPQTGTTGDCTYTYDPRTKEMVISGDGAMGDYAAGKQPWAEFPMEELTIEDGVTTIGNHAFYNIYTLQKVWISSNSNLKTIGVEAFAKSPITFIDIPSKVEIIKEAAFSGCSKLRSIDFSKSTSLKTIENYAFKDVEKWQKTPTGNYSGKQYYYKTLEVPATVESMGMVAFNGDIEEIVIGKNMKQMAGFAISTSVNNGKMYVNRGIPPTVNKSVLGEMESSWTLYVPKGCKSTYQKDAVWKKFYKIIEDENLEKGDDSSQDNSQLAQLLINAWKCNTSNGYKKYTFRENGTAEYKTYFNKTKTLTELSYEFDTSSMLLKLKDISKGTESKYTITKLTEQEMVFDGDTYINVTGSSDEDDDNQGNDDSQDSHVRGPVAQIFRGSGTKSDPYIISDASELRKLSDDVASGMRYKNEYFKMTADVTINRNVLNANGDINASDSARFERWIPIGKNNYSFEGIFDGNGHTIYGIYINSESGGALFRRVNILKNLTLKDSYISGGYAVGFVTTMGVEITGCFNYATLVGRHTSGAYGIAAGISGYYNNNSSDNPSTIIDKCANYGKISGHYRAAGIVAGYKYASNTHIVKNCVNYGDISGDGNYVGGIANHGVATINCVNFGKVTCKYSDTGEVLVGGLASYVSTLNMNNYSCNLMENSINYGKIASYKEDYTAAIAYLYSHNSGSWHAGTKCKNNYFLETSYPRGFVGDTYNAEATMMSAKEMKAQSFLDLLNKNAKALGSGYSQWKFGKDGLPTLEFVKE